MKASQLVDGKLYIIWIGNVAENRWAEAKWNAKTGEFQDSGCWRHKLANVSKVVAR